MTHDDHDRDRNNFPDDLPASIVPASVAISEWTACQGPRPHEWRWVAVPALPNGWRAIVLDDSQCDLLGVERGPTFYRAGAESLDGQFVIFPPSRIESLSEARLIALRGAIQLLPPSGLPATRIE